MDVSSKGLRGECAPRCLFLDLILSACADLILVVLLEFVDQIPDTLKRVFKEFTDPGIRAFGLLLHHPGEAVNAAELGGEAVE